jgi:hypothetical protein
VEPFDLFIPADSTSSIVERPDFKQTFVLPLECQGCRSNVVVFMVARLREKITLVGRSQFEEVMIPDYIPKPVRDFYSQARVAFNCGQTLPAIFMLRTLIEQHMRHMTKATGETSGDELCESYAKTLDKDFNERFPSFKVIYSDLSDAMHRAESNDELFTSNLNKICVHFEAIVVFEKARIGGKRADKQRS